MQFFAYQNSKIIYAEDALKSFDYRCPECHGRLRVKKGLHRRKHFFHLSPTAYCRQSQKNGLHLTIQKKLMALLPNGETTLEKPFSSIRRIADLVWEPKKLIFEIQCSPISLQEAKERMHDYKSLGYRVIWILHDKRFNRRRLSSAEAHLRPHKAFFTSINSKGEGFIYDQYETLNHHLRTYKGPPIPINPREPFSKRPKAKPKKITHSSRLEDNLRFIYYLLLKTLNG